MLRSLYCCLLGSHFVFFLFHAVSTPTIWFCPFLFFVETKTFYSYLSLMENNVGLLGLWALESLSLIVFQLIPAGLAHWAFFIFLISLGPSKAPHPFFCLLKWAISPWLPFPHCPWVNVIYSLFLWVFLLFGPLGHNPIIYLLFLNLSCLFLNLILVFVSILSNIRLTQNLTCICSNVNDILWSCILRL